MKRKPILIMMPLIGLWKQNKYDYTLVLNNDVLLHPKCVLTLVNRMEKGDLIMATAFDMREKVLADRFLSIDEHFMGDCPESEGLNFSAFMVRNRDWLNKVGGADEGFTPAYDFLKGKGGKMYFLITCRWCGKKFIKKEKANFNQKFCCRNCSLARWRKKHKVELKKISKSWSQNNPISSRQIKKRWNDKNKAIKHKWYMKNKEKCISRALKYKAEIASRGEAKRIVKKLGWKKECKMGGVCKGKVTLHHKDENVFNNNPLNLEYLCRKHHGIKHSLEWKIKNLPLVDFYRINQPKLPNELSKTITNAGTYRYKPKTLISAVRETIIKQTKRPPSRKTKKVS